MKRSRLRKVSLAKTSLKKAERLCEKAWKDAAKRRDNYTCQICKASGEGVVLQVDHCFSRMCKQLFYDIRNASTLCQSCHTMKSYRVRGYEKIVDRLVLEREGADFWKFAVETAFSKTAKKWTLQEIEDQTEKLNGMFK